MKAFGCILIVLFLYVSFNSYGNADYTNSTSYISTIYFHSTQANGQDSLSVKFSGSRLIVENLPKDNVLEVYNIMGTKVYTRRINSGTNEYQLTLPRGYYIIKIGKFTKKIAVR